MANEEKQLLRNTIRTEQSRLRDMVRRLGSKLSGLMITCGFLVLTFGIYLLIVPPDPILSARLSLIFAGALGFIGGLNLLCGLLLLLGED
ncbi:MAG: hypothetical protein WCC63_07790 [Candidatus Bathyarchaeia archaeon]